MDKKNYDLIVLGGGPAGYVGAIHAAQNGLKVLLFEKDNIGGMCLNKGCMPSKTLLESASLYRKMKKADSFGIAGVDAKVIKPDWSGMIKRVNKIVSRLTTGVSFLLEKNGVDVVKGEATVLDANNVQSANDIFTTKYLLLASGSKYDLPVCLQNVDLPVYTATNIYSLKELPKSIVIIGAGVIGVEFAFIFSMLGVKVSLVEKHTLPVSEMDSDLIKELIHLFKKNKIQFIPSAKVSSVKKNQIYLDRSGTEELVAGEMILYAGQRKANLKPIDNLIKAGLKLENNFVKTDLQMRTNLKNIYATGDINGKFMSAHVASKEAIVAVDSILKKGKDIQYEMMPYNMYTIPEFASVGLKEHEAVEQGYSIDIAKFPLLANGKALIEDQFEGFVKIIFEKNTKEILGFHIVAQRATDLISEALVMMTLEATMEDFTLTTHPHPTISEAIMEAGLKGIGSPIHIV